MLRRAYFGLLTAGCRLVLRADLYENSGGRPEWVDEHLGTSTDRDYGHVLRVVHPPDPAELVGEVQVKAVIFGTNTLASFFKNALGSSWDIDSRF